jgi:hypothetical protein
MLVQLHSSTRKSPRGPFALYTNATCRPLELLHTDIAGPMQVASAGGAKYFVTKLDDFTKFKAVKPLKKRSEAPGFIKHIVVAPIGRLQQARRLFPSEMIGEENF